MALDATAAKVKKKSGRASHLYHQKAFIANATKAKKESAHASHLYHQKVFSTNAEKVKKESAKLLISLTKGHKMKKNCHFIPGRYNSFGRRRRGQ